MDYLLHHGVKGMKWGVRKGRDITSSLYRHHMSNRAREKLKDRNVLEYTKKDSLGNTERAYRRVSKGQLKGLQKRKLIDINGDISEEKQADALKYLNSRSDIIGASVGVAITGAAMLGAGYLGYKNRA